MTKEKLLKWSEVYKYSKYNNLRGLLPKQCAADTHSDLEEGIYLSVAARITLRRIDNEIGILEEQVAGMPPQKSWVDLAQEQRDNRQGISRTDRPNAELPNYSKDYRKLRSALLTVRHHVVQMQDTKKPVPEAIGSYMRGSIDTLLDRYKNFGYMENK